MSMQGVENVHSPLLYSRPVPFDGEGNDMLGLDFSKLSMVPRRTHARTRAQEGLMNHSQIPMFMKRYCIVWHYRPPSRFSTAALSVFRLHNETVNIWSHIAGAISMWCLAFCFSLAILTPVDMYKMVVHGQITENSRSLLAAGVPIWPLIVFDVCSSMTLVLSALAHTFACMPKPASSLFWKMDQLGIALGILSMYFPGVIYLLHGYPPAVPWRYILGIPERLRPGRYDRFGASHQIFHICIVICFVMFHSSNVHLWEVLSVSDSAGGTAGMYVLSRPYLMPTEVFADF